MESDISQDRWYSDASAWSPTPRTSQTSDHPDPLGMLLGPETEFTKRGFAVVNGASKGGWGAFRH
jgi:hypothetical protein